jgi:hypothetical protein
MSSWYYPMKVQRLKAETVEKKTPVNPRNVEYVEATGGIAS